MATVQPAPPPATLMATYPLAAGLAAGGLFAGGIIAGAIYTGVTISHLDDQAKIHLLDQENTELKRALQAPIFCPLGTVPMSNGTNRKANPPYICVTPTAPLAPTSTTRIEESTITVTPLSTVISGNLKCILDLLSTTKTKMATNAKTYPSKSPCDSWLHFFGPLPYWVCAGLAAVLWLIYATLKDTTIIFNENLGTSPTTNVWTLTMPSALVTQLPLGDPGISSVAYVPIPASPSSMNLRVFSISNQETTLTGEQKDELFEALLAEVRTVAALLWGTKPAHITGHVRGDEATVGTHNSTVKAALTGELNDMTGSDLTPNAEDDLDIETHLAIAKELRYENRGIDRDTDNFDSNSKASESENNGEEHRKRPKKAATKPEPKDDATTPTIDTANLSLLERTQMIFDPNYQIYHCEAAGNFDMPEIQSAIADLWQQPSVAGPRTTSFFSRGIQSSSEAATTTQAPGSQPQLPLSSSSSPKVAEIATSPSSYTEQTPGRNSGKVISPNQGNSKRAIELRKEEHASKLAKEKEDREARLTVQQAQKAEKEAKRIEKHLGKKKRQEEKAAAEKANHD